MVTAILFPSRSRSAFSRSQRNAATARGGAGMEVIIKGEAKEIAALLLEIEGRRNKETDVDKIAQTLSKALSSTRNMNSLL